MGSSLLYLQNYLQIATLCFVGGEGKTCRKIMLIFKALQIQSSVHIFEGENPIDLLHAKGSIMFRLQRNAFNLPRPKLDKLTNLLVCLSSQLQTP